MLASSLVPTSWTLLRCPKTDPRDWNVGGTWPRGVRRLEPTRAPPSGAGWNPGHEPLINLSRPTVMMSRLSARRSHAFLSFERVVFPCVVKPAVSGRRRCAGHPDWHRAIPLQIAGTCTTWARRPRRLSRPHTSGQHPEHGNFKEISSIRKSIEGLGFKYADPKPLISHGACDHDEGTSHHSDTMPLM